MPPCHTKVCLAGMEGLGRRSRMLTMIGREPVRRDRPSWTGFREIRAEVGEMEPKALPRAGE